MPPLKPEQFDEKGRDAFNGKSKDFQSARKATLKARAAAVTHLHEKSQSRERYPDPVKEPEAFAKAEASKQWRDNHLLLLAPTPQEGILGMHEALDKQASTPGIDGSPPPVNTHISGVARDGDENGYGFGSQVRVRALDPTRLDANRRAGKVADIPVNLEVRCAFENLPDPLKESIRKQDEELNRDKAVNYPVITDRVPGREGARTQVVVNVQGWMQAGEDTFKAVPDHNGYADLQSQNRENKSPAWAAKMPSQEEVKVFLQGVREALPKDNEGETVIPRDYRIQNSAVLKMLKVDRKTQTAPSVFDIMDAGGKGPDGRALTEQETKKLNVEVYKVGATQLLGASTGVNAGTSVAFNLEQLSTLLRQAGGKESPNATTPLSVESQGQLPITRDGTMLENPTPSGFNMRLRRGIKMGMVASVHPQPERNRATMAGLDAVRSWQADKGQQAGQGR